MMETYGVESARNTIIGQLNEVFGVYGITVNHRHLSLIGDYMVPDLLPPPPLLVPAADAAAATSSFDI